MIELRPEDLLFYPRLFVHFNWLLQLKSRMTHRWRLQVSHGRGDL